MQGLFSGWFSRVEKGPGVDDKGNGIMVDVRRDFIGCGQQQHEVTSKTKYFLNDKPCQKTDIKVGKKIRLLIDGRPALSVKAYESPM